MKRNYYIRTFGCAANEADSQRIAAVLEKRGYKPTSDIKKADLVVINSCIVRQSAENRVYGLLNKFKVQSAKCKVTIQNSKLGRARRLSFSSDVKDSSDNDLRILDSGAKKNFSRVSLGKLFEKLEETRRTVARKMVDKSPVVVLTGCLAGWALRDKTGKNLAELRKKIGQNVDIVLTEELADFDVFPERNYEKRQSKIALIPISWGCSHFCSYCVVPYARGKVLHRPAKDILAEVEEAVAEGRTHIVLLGENVNTWYGDIEPSLTVFLKNARLVGIGKPQKFPKLARGKIATGVQFKNNGLMNSNFSTSFEKGQLRAISDTISAAVCPDLATWEKRGMKGWLVNKVKDSFSLERTSPKTWKSKLDKGERLTETRQTKRFGFSDLLKMVAEIPGVELVEFMSPNPWDFPNELIKVIAQYPNISKTIHLPLQSGDDRILKKMNRNYTTKSYLDLIKNLKSKILNVKISTDIIVGFPGETEKAFGNTVKLCRKIGFYRAYVNRYSPRPGTAAAKLYKDDVPAAEKKRRWLVLEKMINKNYHF